MTLGTAKIEETAGLVTVTYMNQGSFLTGRQDFGNWNAALRFCRLRALRVVATHCAA
jgi:hypothetical protein